MEKRIHHSEVSQAVQHLKSAASGAGKAAHAVSDARRALQQAESAAARAAQNASNSAYAPQYGAASAGNGAVVQACARVEQAEREHQSAMGALDQVRSGAQQLLQRIQSEQQKLKASSKKFSNEVKGIEVKGIDFKTDKFHSSFDSEAKQLLSWANDLEQALRRSASVGRVESTGGGSGLEARVGGSSRAYNNFAKPGAYKFEPAYYPSIDQQLTANPYGSGGSYAGGSGALMRTYKRVADYLPRLYR